MNKNKYWFAIAAAAIVMPSCTEKDFENFMPVKEGSEITFGAALNTDDNKTRTYYGGEVTVGTKKVWPIYWNYQEGNQDEVYIYSPQAASGRNQQRYRVDAKTADMKTAANVIRLGEVGIQASSATTYDFYGLYPAAAITAPMDGGETAPTVHATLTGSQSVAFAGTKDIPSTQIPAPTTDAVAYLTTPDMNNCLMIANETNKTPEEGTPVSLQFTPFSTVLDITITGPVDNNTITNQDAASITSVQITADAPISGNFSYNFKTKKFDFAADASKTILIETRGLDSDGNRVGITLQNKNTLNLQAFMIPNPAVKNLSVTVFTSDSQTWTKNLVLGTDASYLVASQIHKVTLPPLRFAEAAFDYSVWLSQLDPRIYISEISLPGSCLSFNSAKYNVTGNMVTQTLDIAGQFEAGIRVFQAHAWVADGTSSVPGVKPLHLVTSNGQDTNVRLLSVIETLQKEMKENHGNEFCVLILSDYTTGNGLSHSDFYKSYAALSKKMAEDGLLADNVNASTTLADVKGKVILKFAPNGTNLVSGEGLEGLNTSLKNLQSLSNTLNGSKSLFNWWTSACDSQVSYQPLSFEGLGTFQFTEGTISHPNWWSDYTYTAPKIDPITPGTACDAANMLITLSPYNDRNHTVTLGSINLDYISEPTNGFDNVNNMWYIYSEQANPSTSVVEKNTQNVVNALSTYDRASHNKFYMTYCGGVGSGTTTANITSTANSAWFNAIKDVSMKPFGWVLFNDVVKQSSKNTPTANNIQKVISNNNDIKFKLFRKDTSSPQGARAKRGGKLF